nr:type II secretion system F family protein [Flexivirga aerilata]
MLEGIGPAIAAGVAPSTAVATSALLSAAAIDDGRLRDDLRRLAREAAAGAELAPVWAQLHQAHGLPALASVARAWALSEQLGCGVAESLATASAMMREQVDRDRRVDVVTAGPRATMQLLTLLPLAGVGIAALIGVSPWRLYAGTLGAVVLVCGALLILGGRRLVRRMIRRACAPAEIA